MIGPRHPAARGASRRLSPALSRALGPALLLATGCTETPSFPPCLDPYASYMNACPGLDAAAASDSERGGDAANGPDAIPGTAAGSADETVDGGEP